jgi:hypothetical protein
VIGHRCSPLIAATGRAVHVRLSVDWDKAARRDSRDHDAGDQDITSEWPPGISGAVALLGVIRSGAVDVICAASVVGTDSFGAESKRRRGAIERP